MTHQTARLHVLRHVSARLGLAIGIAFAMAPGTPTSSAEAPKADSRTAPRSSPECEGAQTAIDRLICTEPSLAVIDAALDAAFRDYRDRAARPAEREARLAEQRLWLDGRARACPAATQGSSKAWRENLPRRPAGACLSRIYEQRVAVLRYERNAAAWPRLRFRPALVEGVGTKLCEDLQRDLVASFFGRGLFVNPLGEREIGFAPIAGLGDDPIVLRADID